MTLLLTAALLLDAGAAEGHYFDLRDLDDVAIDIATACDAEPPTLPPVGEDCIRAAVTLWHVETAGTFARHPSPRHAYGPLQVLAVPRLTPPAAVLRWHPVDGFRAGLHVFRLKLRRAAGRMQRAFELYNGHPRYRRAYGRRAWRLWLSLERGAGEV